MNGQKQGAALPSLGILLVACSAREGASASENSALQTQALCSSNEVASPAPPRKSEVIRIDTVPFARCRLTGGTESDAVEADQNGQLRFYTPPDSWGQRVAVDCQLSERTPPVNALAEPAKGTSHRFDLFDRTTFVTEPEAVERVKAVRPALSGDVLAIPQNELVHCGSGSPRSDDESEAICAWLIGSRGSSRSSTSSPCRTWLHTIPHQFRGRSNSNNWSGPVLENSAFGTTTTYDYEEIFTSLTRINGYF